MTLNFKDRLVGERITLVWTKPDIDMARAIFSVIDENREHLRTWFQWEKQTLKLEDSLRYLFRREEQEKLGETVEYGLYVDDAYIGNIEFFDIDEKKRSAEIGYWLALSATRNGYMTEAVKILEKEFFEDFGFHRLQIRCDEKNEASTRVAVRCGYQLEGTQREASWSEYFGGFRSVLVYSKLASEYKE